MFISEGAHQEHTRRHRLQCQAQSGLHNFPSPLISKVFPILHNTKKGHTCSLDAVAFSLPLQSANSPKVVLLEEKKKGGKRKRLKVLKKSTNESIGDILEKAELAVKLAPDLYNVLNSTNKTS